MKNIEWLLKILLAIMMIVFGLNKFLGFLETPPPEGPEAQAFLGAMFTSYLGKLVAVIEVVGGLLLLIPRTTFIGLLILAPVILNIIIFHFAHDFVGNGIWIVTTLLFVAIGFFHQHRLNALLK